MVSALASDAKVQGTIAARGYLCSDDGNTAHSPSDRDINLLEGPCAETHIPCLSKRQNSFLVVHPAKPRNPCG